MQKSRVENYISDNSLFKWNSARTCLFQHQKITTIFMAYAFRSHCPELLQFDFVHDANLLYADLWYRATARYGWLLHKPS